MRGPRTTQLRSGGFEHWLRQFSRRHGRALVLYDRPSAPFVRLAVAELVQEKWPSGRLIHFRGRLMRDLETLSEEWQSVMPPEDEVGWDDWNALGELLHERGVWGGTRGPVTFVWSDADYLFKADRKTFEKAYSVIAEAALKASNDPVPGVFPPAVLPGPRERKPVGLIVLADYEVMIGEASTPGSFLYLLPEERRQAWPEGSTRLEAVWVLGAKNGEAGE